MRRAVSRVRTDHSIVQCVARSRFPIAFSTSVSISPLLVSRDNELFQYQHVFLVERFGHPYIVTGATYDDDSLWGLWRPFDKEHHQLPILAPCFIFPLREGQCYISAKVATMLHSSLCQAVSIQNWTVTVSQAPL